MIRIVVGDDLCGLHRIAIVIQDFTHVRIGWPRTKQAGTRSGMLTWRRAVRRARG